MTSRSTSVRRPSTDPLLGPTQVLPAARRRRVPRGLLIGAGVLAGLAFVCVAALALFYFLLGFGRPNQTAQIVPADSPLMISLQPDPRQALHLCEAGNLEAMLPALAAVPGLQQMADQTQAVLLSELQVDLRQDVLPWIGGEASLVVMDAGSGASGAVPSLILAVATRNEARSDEFLSKLQAVMAEQGAQFAEEVHGGVAVVYQIPEYEGAFAPAFATIDGLVVVGSDLTAVEQAIDTALGERTQTLADQQAYDSVLEALPANRAGYIYLDVPMLLAQLGGVAELPVDAQAVQAAGVSFGVEKDGLRIDYVLAYDVERLTESQRAAAERPLPQFRMVGQVPDEVLAYVGSEDLAAVWKTGMEMAADSPELDEALAAIRAETGVDLSVDILARLTGEYAVVLLSDASGFLGVAETPVGVVVLAETGEPEALRASLDALSSAMEQSGVQVSRRTIGAASLTLLEDSGAGWSLGYGLEGGVVLLGSSEQALTTMLAGSEEPLAENPVFRRAVEHSHERANAQLYIDLARSLAPVYGMMSPSEREAFDRDVRPYVEPIRAVMLSSGAIDRNGMQPGSLYLYLPGE